MLLATLDFIVLNSLILMSWSSVSVVLKNTNMNTFLCDEFIVNSHLLIFVLQYHLPFRALVSKYVYEVINIPTMELS